MGASKAPERKRFAKFWANGALSCQCLAKVQSKQVKTRMTRGHFQECRAKNNGTRDPTYPDVLEPCIWSGRGQRLDQNHDPVVALPGGEAWRLDSIGTGSPNEKTSVRFLKVYTRVEASLALSQHKPN